MLSDGERAGCGSESREGRGVFGGFAVGRVKECEIGGVIGEEHGGAAAHDGGFAGDAERAQIFAKDGQGGRVSFDEDDVFRTAAEGLDADRARAGVSIEEDCVFEPRHENGKERLAEAIRRGTNRETGRTLEMATAKTAGDDAHPLYNRAQRAPHALCARLSDLAEAVFALPVLLDVADGLAHFLLVPAFNESLGFAGCGFEQVGIAHQVREAQAGNA